jgi:hypothetical protein
MIALLFCFYSALMVQTGGTGLDNLWCLLVERLESTRIAGLHRIEVEGGHVLAAPALMEGEAGEFDVLRRSHSDGRVVYRPVARLRESQLSQLRNGKAIAGLASGDLLAHAGRRPRLAVRLASTAGVTSNALKQIETGLASYMAATGLYEAVKPADSWEGVLFFQGDPAEVRTSLERQSADALLNVVVHIAGERVHLICQVISSDGGSDELFGVSGTLTPELALVLSEVGERQGGASLQPIFSMPVPGDALDVARAQLDRAEGDEIVVLRPSELLIYTVSSEALNLIRRVSLAGLPPALYATRRPVGNVIAMDLDGNGSTELLIGGNLWAGGAVLWIDRERISFSLFDLQPLETAAFDGRPAFLAGRYRPGEDTFEDTIFILDRSLTAREAGELDGLRSLARLDTSGESYVELTAFGGIDVWDRRSGNLSKVMNSGENMVAFCSALPGLSGEWILAVESAAGGSNIRPINALTGAALPMKTVSALDIMTMCAYNPPGSQPSAIVLLGRDAFGEMRLVVCGWPW